MKKFIHLTFLVPIFFVACTSDPETKRTGPLAIKKKTRVVSPKNNQKFVLGEVATFKVKPKKDSTVVDSLVLYFNDQKFVGSFETGVDVPTDITGVGVPRLILNVYLKGGVKESLYPKIRVYPQEPVKYTYLVKNAYPHDPQAYTQGLFFKNGELYEGTGKHGTSYLKKVDLFSGEAINSIGLDSKYFGEGIALVNDRIYQLTYRAQQVFVYDLSFNKQNTLSYDNEEGWGLTNMGDTLVMSDGSEYLYFRRPEDFSEIKKIAVWDNKGKVSMLNELEYIDGYIYANVYLTDRIVKIDPSSGSVIGNLDLSGLYTNRNLDDADYVLNGIAYEAGTKKIYVTGKFWPSIYEIDLVEAKTNL